MKDLDVHMRRIKADRPPDPTSDNCLDFALGDSGYGVRIIVTYFEDGKWGMSTSIGWLSPGKYTPMLLSEWTPQLRHSATEIAQEVLEYFDIDQSSKSAIQSETLVLFRFRENQ